jgi:hypothetical protein
MKPEEIETPTWPHDPLVRLTTEIEVLIIPILSKSDSLGIPKSAAK